MQPESNKHGPRGDEDLKKSVEPILSGAPTEPRSAPERRELDPEPAIDPGTRADLGTFDRERRNYDRRSELAARTAAARFPADKEQLLEVAREDGADGDVIALLQRLPNGQEFENLEAVWEALGQEREPGR